MNKAEYKDMWVFIEHDGTRIQPVSLELCCETRRLCDNSGDALCAVIVGNLPEKEIKKVAECGIDRIIHATGTGYEYFNIDAYANLFTVLCQKYKPSAVMVGGTVFGRDFAPRFACRLTTGCTSDATALIYNSETKDIEFVEPAVGGKLMAVITVPSMRPQVGTIRQGTFKYAPVGMRPYKVIEERVDFPPEKIRTKTLNFCAYGTDESFNITEAEIIVCVGNGLKGADALPRYRHLADKLGGKLACTRPVFERGILPFKLVIGQSGVVVKPKLYIGFGISGAINHITGISDADRIVAVNKDPNATIFNYCDYGIIGDMDEICDLLIARKAGK